MLLLYLSFHFISFSNTSVNNIFSSERISKTGNLGSDLIFCQYKLDLEATLMEIKSVNPQLNQDQMSKELGFSSSTLRRFRQDINMPSP